MKLASNIEADPNKFYLCFKESNNDVSSKRFFIPIFRSGESYQELVI